LGKKIKDNDLSSATIPTGYQVTFYEDANFGGATLVKTGDTPCFTSDNIGSGTWNDRVSSLKIRKLSGNPIFPGWYADPEARIFGNTYWVYPTYSAPYEQQIFLDAFSSPDLITWTKHSSVVSTTQIKWANRAMWAPSTVEKDGKYYLFFGANDIQESDTQVGGIGIAVASSPGGPFTDYLGKPLIDKYFNGAQPIDQFVFKDTDGQYYMTYGGHGHCNIVKLNSTFTGLDPFPDGTIYKEITPDNYTEGSFMIVRNSKYYLMWSEGYWGGSDYSVSYAIGDSPIGPFTKVGKILEQDPAIAKGAGHHSVIKDPSSDKWYIVYHRRPLNQTDANARQTCIDRMYFDAQGYIQPVKITNQGVERQPL